MARSNMRFVQNTDPNIIVASERPKPVQIPVFDLPGAVFHTTSPPWHPPYPIVLKTWYVVSSTVGTSLLTIAVLKGDNLFDVDGDFAGAIDLAATQRVNTGPVVMPNGTISYPVITPDNWIKVAFSGSSGHSDLVVQIYGQAV